MFSFNSAALDRFEQKFLCPDGVAVAEPLVIIDSASIILNDEGCEKDDVIIGLLVQLMIVLQKYDATAIAVCFPKDVNMMVAGAKAIEVTRYCSSSGSSYYLGLLDDNESNEMQIQGISLRRLLSVTVTRYTTSSFVCIGQTEA